MQALLPELPRGARVLRASAREDPEPASLVHRLLVGLGELEKLETLSTTAAAAAATAAAYVGGEQAAGGPCPNGAREYRDYDELCSSFEAQVHAVGAEHRGGKARPVVVVVEAAELLAGLSAEDQAEETGGGCWGLRWLPAMMPRGVGLLLVCSSVSP